MLTSQSASGDSLSAFDYDAEGYTFEPIQSNDVTAGCGGDDSDSEEAVFVVA